MNNFIIYYIPSISSYDMYSPLKWNKDNWYIFFNNKSYIFHFNDSIKSFLQIFFTPVFIYDLQKCIDFTINITIINNFFKSLFFLFVLRFVILNWNYNTYSYSYLFIKNIILHSIYYGWNSTYNNKKYFYKYTKIIDDRFFYLIINIIYWFTTNLRDLILYSFIDNKKNIFIYNYILDIKYMWRHYYHIFFKPINWFLTKSKLAKPIRTIAYYVLLPFFNIFTFWFYSFILSIFRSEYEYTLKVINWFTIKEFKNKPWPVKISYSLIRILDYFCKFVKWIIDGIQFFKNNTLRTIFTKICYFIFNLLLLKIKYFYTNKLIFIDNFYLYIKKVKYNIWIRIFWRIFINLFKITYTATIISFLYFILFNFYLHNNQTRQLVIWYLIIIIFYLIITTFNHFLLLYKKGKYVSSINRFWKRTSIVFWLLEFFLFFLFFYYYLNASQELLYFSDINGAIREYLIPFKNLFISTLLLILSIFICWSIIINNENKYYSQNIILLMIITLFMFYNLCIESYQFIYILNNFNEKIFIFNEKKQIWFIDFEENQYRVKIQYFIICLIAKYWHFLFIFIGWFYLVVKNIQEKKINYDLLAYNKQNLLILLTLNLICLIEWLKWYIKYFFEITYKWFHIDFDIYLIFKTISEIFKIYYHLVKNIVYIFLPKFNILTFKYILYNFINLFINNFANSNIEVYLFFI